MRTSLVQSSLHSPKAPCTRSMRTSPGRCRDRRNIGLPRHTRPTGPGKTNVRAKPTKKPTSVVLGGQHGGLGPTPHRTRRRAPRAPGQHMGPGPTPPPPTRRAPVPEITSVVLGPEAPLSASQEHVLELPHLRPRPASQGKRSRWTHAESDGGAFIPPADHHAHATRAREKQGVPKPRNTFSN